MTTTDEMISRYRELEQIAINAPDVAARKRATEERINLTLLIQKQNQRIVASGGAV